MNPKLKPIRAYIWTLACLVALAAALPTSRVFAHASPHVLDILFRDDGYVLLSNRGLIFGNEQRSQWSLMCNEALGINTSERPSLVSLPNGALLVGTSQGLQQTTDSGCTWSPVAPFEKTSIPALARDPSTPNRFYLSAYSPMPDDKGGLYVSEDGGASWQRTLAGNDRDFMRSLRVAPGDPTRVYATGKTWDEAGVYSYYIARSSDSGKTWERQPFMIGEDEGELRLLSVSPTDPNLVTLQAASRSPMAGKDRLLVSRDAGATFSSPLSMMLLSATAFSADGMKAWVVGQDGLFESTDGLMTFTRMGESISMSYVVERDSELLACGFYAGTGNNINGIGMSKGDSNFESFMQMNEVSAPLACDPASKTATTCAPWWLDWQRELGLEMPGSAGAAAPVPPNSSGGNPASVGMPVSPAPAVSAPQPPAAGPAADPAVTPPSRAGEGCAASGAAGRSAGSGALLSALCLAGLWLRSRRRRRRLIAELP